MKEKLILGQESSNQEWGRSPLWNHFDLYQLAHYWGDHATHDHGSPEGETCEQVRRRRRRRRRGSERERERAKILFNICLQVMQESTFHWDAIDRVSWINKLHETAWTWAWWWCDRLSDSWNSNLSHVPLVNWNKKGKRTSLSLYKWGKTSWIDYLISFSHWNRERRKRETEQADRTWPGFSAARRPRQLRFTNSDLHLVATLKIVH